MAAPTTLDVFRQAIDHMQADRIDEWLDLCHDDVVLEFPFAPPPIPQRIVGKPAVATQLGARAEHRLAAPQVENLAVHLCLDPSTLVAEFSVRGADGSTRPAIAVVNVRAGLITLYRDYWNPLDVRPDHHAGGR
jgi:ketosteroid isomerase-like protein